MRDAGRPRDHVRTLSPRTGSPGEGWGSVARADKAHDIVRGQGSAANLRGPSGRLNSVEHMILQARQRAQVRLGHSAMSARFKRWIRCRRRERNRQLTCRLRLRQFVPAERELRLTSPRSETPHDKARAGVLYPNGYLLLRNLYRTVFERICTGAIGATNILPGDLHMSRPALRLLVWQLVATSEGILGLVGPKAKTPHCEKGIGPHPPNIDLFLLDGYGAAPEWKAVRAFGALDVVPVDLHQLPCLRRA